MLNRRNAILAASGSVLLSGRQLTAASASSTDGRNQADAAFNEHSSATAQDVAATCLECATACTDIAAISVEAKSFAEDCRDICTVTATLLSRQGPLAPAICQACADACARLAELCEQIGSSLQLRNCHSAVLNCAKACRLNIVRAS